MRWIKHIVFSNLWVAFCFTSLVLLSFLLRPSPIDYSYLGFCFFATLSIYNLQRYIKLHDAHIEGQRESWYLKRKNQLLIFGLLALIVSGISFLMSSGIEFGLLITAILITFFYVPPKSMRFFQIREYGFLKLVSIGIVWAILSLPQFDLQEHYFVFICRAMWIISITIPFDIRDVYRDKEEDIKTLPSIIGEKRSRLLGLILFLLGMGGEVFLTQESQIAFLPVIILGGIAIWKAKSSSSDLYVAGIIEGIPLLYLINFGLV
jgi:4-hydroxybenzoate polyprenyltransferase